MPAHTLNRQWFGAGASGASGTRDESGVSRAGGVSMDSTQSSQSLSIAETLTIALLNPYSAKGTLRECAILYPPEYFQSDSEVILLFFGIHLLYDSFYFKFSFLVFFLSEDLQIITYLKKH